MSESPELPTAAETPDALRVARDLAAVLAELGPDERRVLLALARRLLAGQHAYGLLDVARDKRDWRAERALEIQDLLVYTAIAEVAEAARGKGGGNAK